MAARLSLVKNPLGGSAITAARTRASVGEQVALGRLRGPGRVDQRGGPAPASGHGAAVEEGKGIEEPPDVGGAAVHLRAQDHELKGEMTLLIGKAEGEAESSKKRDVVSRLQEIMREQKIDENAALKVLAKEQGISKSEAYRELQRLRRKK